MPATPAPQLYSVRQAAARLGCSRDHVYDLIAAGTLPAIDIGNKAQLLRVPETALVAFIADRTKHVPLASGQ